MALRPALLGLALLASAGTPFCSFQEPADIWTLYQKLMDSGQVDVHVADGLDRLPVERALERLEGTTRFRGTIRGLDEEGDPGVARIVIGSVRDPVAVGLAARLGVKIAKGEKGFHLWGRPYRNPGDALIATFEDPDRRGLPVTLYLGNDLAVLSRYVDDLTPVWRPGFQVWRSGELELQGPLRSNGSIVATELEDYLDAWRERPRSELLYDGERVRVRIPGDADVPEPARLREYALLLDRVCGEVAAAFGHGDTGAPQADVFVEIRFHPGDYRERGGLSGLSRFNPVARYVHAILAPHLPDDGGAATARAVAVALLGDPPAAEWLLDGVAGHAAESWWGRRMGEWVGFLHLAELDLTVGELTDPTAPLRFSPHRLVPLRGALFGHLLAERGSEELAAIWSGERALVIDEELEVGFTQHLTRMLALDGRGLIARQAERYARALRHNVHRGINLISDVAESEAALLSPALEGSLLRARELGVDSVALVFFAFSERRPLEHAGDLRPGSIDPLVSDLALAAAASMAGKLGLKTMLAPQLLQTPSGTWPDSGRTSREEVARFFEDYGRFLTHYALLAELLECETLCIGNELRSMTLTAAEPDDTPGYTDLKQAKLEGWLELIRRTRGTFAGALTYAADGGREVEQIEFWPALDYVGVDFFFGVQTPGRPQLDRQARIRLERQLERVARLAQSVKKPLLLVQVGFPSNATSAERPMNPRGTVDLVQQRRLYEIFAEALETTRASFDLGGLYLYSWDPDPAAGGANDPRHTPQNKPAEAVLPRLFGDG
ncbi:MAG: hypothetical protein O7B99_06300 [Planctomycetota bacterium]|nr:hypothetical protein [Planctomycetota bacterium]